MYGMPPGFEALLRRKYAILAQQANADMIRAQASAGLDNTRARLLPQESNANVAATGAATEQTKAETIGIGIKNKKLPALLDAEIGYQRALGRDANARAGYTNAQTDGYRSLSDRVIRLFREENETGIPIGGGFGL